MSHHHSNDCTVCMVKNYKNLGTGLTENFRGRRGRRGGYRRGYRGFRRINYPYYGYGYYPYWYGSRLYSPSYYDYPYSSRGDLLTNVVSPTSRNGIVFTVAIVALVVAFMALRR